MPLDDTGRGADRLRISELETQAELDRQLIEYLKKDKIADAALIENLERALVSSRQIGAAVGILMAARKLTYDAAFETLANASQACNRKLRHVAEELLMTGALPSASRLRSDR